MTKTDDDNGNPWGGRRPTLIVPGGDIEAVAKAADRRKAGPADAHRPPADPGGFEAQRVMIPGGDLDAITRHAEDRGPDDPSGPPAGPVDPIGPAPDGDETEMNFQERGTFVDSGLDEAGARKHPAGFRPVQSPDKSTWRMGTQGFRFRDGSDDDPATPPGHFHDDGFPADQRRVFRAEPPAVDDASAKAAFRGLAAEDASIGKTFSRGSDVRTDLRSPVSNDASRQPDPHPVGKTDAESGLFLDVSTAQLELVIRRIMERVFVEKVEAILKQVLENAVEKEMRRFRERLANEPAFSGGSEEEGAA